MGEAARATGDECAGAAVASLGQSGSRAGMGNKSSGVGTTRGQAGRVGSAERGEGGRVGCEAELPGAASDGACEELGSVATGMGCEERGGSACA
jgi:hypothetical protein